MVNREVLIELAKNRPTQDPEVREMLLQWIDETSIVEVPGQKLETSEYLDVGIMHTAMKYRLGFLTKIEALTELEELGLGIASIPNESRARELKMDLDHLVIAIENDTFDVVTPRP